MPARKPPPPTASNTSRVSLDEVASQRDLLKRLTNELKDSVEEHIADNAEYEAAGKPYVTVTYHQPLKAVAEQKD